jgi:hypothetical protein
MTTQEKALKEAKKHFGHTAFTEDHINYRRVGYKKDGKVLTVMADTWKEAIASLRVA